MFAHAVIARVHDAGAQAQGEGSSIVLEDSRIAGVDQGSDGLQGFGLYVTLGASLEARRVVIDDATAVGALAAAGGTLILEDVAVRDTAPRERLGSGGGLEAQRAGVIDASRTILEGVSGQAIFATDPGSRIDLRDSVIRDVGTDPFDHFGRGAVAGTGARLALTGVLIERCAEAGVVGSFADTTVTLADVVVRDVRASARGLGVGAGAFGGSRIDAERLAVLHLAGAGLLAGPGIEPDGGPSVLVVADALVRDVSRSPIGVSETGMLIGREVAYAVHAGAGATVEASRLRVDQGGHGVVAIGGEVRVMQGVITTQIEGAAATAAMGQVTLVDVTRQDNADDEIVDDETLPAAAALPPPTAVCLDAPECP